MPDLPRLTIYTDGGSDPNPGPGGWGALLIDESSGNQQELSGFDPDTTNNRMELTAAIEALRALPQPSAVRLYTDSEYLKKGITEWLPGWIRKGWMTSSKQPVKNSDLWQELSAETKHHQITWQWVRGHAGNIYNERVDQLATAARQGTTPPPAAKRAAARIAPAGPAPDYTAVLRIWSVKSHGPGGYAFRIAPANSASPNIEGNGHLAEATGNRLLLRAALEALRATPPNAVVRVYCPDDYLFKGMTQWIKGWQKRDWITSTHKRVEHRDLWEALLSEAGTRRVQWEFEPNPAPELVGDLVQIARVVAEQQS